MFDFDLKPLNPEAIPKALQKADRYRLLNEPEEAESISLDILAVAPDNPEALVTLLLALSDQFRTDYDAQCYARARELLPRLPGDYERSYYAGILCERRGSATLDRGSPGAESVACTLFRQAMDWYERAEALRPPDNDDAPLRWNTCVRMLQKHHYAPAGEETYEPALLE
jgi:tetratricopeptide (TPR) repeat protein